MKALRATKPRPPLLSCWINWPYWSLVTSTRQISHSLSCSTEDDILDCYRVTVLPQIHAPSTEHSGRPHTRGDHSPLSVWTTGACVLSPHRVGGFRGRAPSSLTHIRVLDCCRTIERPEAGVIASPRLTRRHQVLLVLSVSWIKARQTTSFRTGPSTRLCDSALPGPLASRTTLSACTSLPN